MANRRPRRMTIPRLFVVLALGGPFFSGCSDSGFAADVPLWHAGFGWEYDQEVQEASYVEGTPPGNIEDLASDQEANRNETFRLEVFNSTAASVEGIPIYALAVLTRELPDENASEEEPAPDLWDAWVFSADLNYVEPTYLDWRNQEVQLSGNQGGATDGEQPEDAQEPTPDETTATPDEEFNQPENEVRRLDWPLTKGHEWRHEERIPELDVDGVFAGKATGKTTARVPAGNFSAIRIEGTRTANDLSDLEQGIRDSLESQGGEVRELSLDYVSRYHYAYAQDVLNFVSYEEEHVISLSAEGVDESGTEYDFTFTNEVITQRRLVKFQLAEGVEKPLTFALDVKRGVYSPKPITPASHLAVEILATAQSINKLSDEAKVMLGVRIFNSTAGEKRLRAAEASYPEMVSQAEFKSDYDHTYLEIAWVFQNVNAKNEFTEFRREGGDTVQLNGAFFATPGLKQVQATLKIKDGPEGPGPQIFTDSVLFEVYTHGNMTGVKSSNASAQEQFQGIRVRFNVEQTVTRVTVNALADTVPTQGQCPFFSQQLDCLRVFDAQNRRPPDERGEQMKFETTRASQFAPGTWTAEYAQAPTAPSQKAVFEVIVRYRPGV